MRRLVRDLIALPIRSFWSRVESKVALFFVAFAYETLKFVTASAIYVNPSNRNSSIPHLEYGGYNGQPSFLLNSLRAKILKFRHFKPKKAENWNNRNSEYAQLLHPKMLYWIPSLKHLCWCLSWEGGGLSTDPWWVQKKGLLKPSDFNFCGCFPLQCSFCYGASLARKPSLVALTS